MNKQTNKVVGVYDRPATNKKWWIAIAVAACIAAIAIAIAVAL